MTDVLISAADLAPLVAAGDVVLLDVRWALGDPHGHQHYLEGHIPGAVFVNLDTELAAPASPQAGRHPLPDIADLQAAARRWGIGADSTVVIYDNGGSMSASRAWWLLRWAGAPRRAASSTVASPPGRAAGRRPEASDESVDPAPGRRHQSSTAGHLPTYSTADARPPPCPPPEPCSTPAPPSATAARPNRSTRGPGTSPGAVSMPTAGEPAGGRTCRSSRLPRPAARALRRRSAPPTTPRSVSYCGSGVTAAHEIAALAVAGIDVGALPPAPGPQWSADPSRPAATGAQP